MARLSISTPITAREDEKKEKQGKICYAISKFKKEAKVNRQPEKVGYRMEKLFEGNFEHFCDLSMASVEK